MYTVLIFLQHVIVVSVVLQCNCDNTFWNLVVSDFVVEIMQYLASALD